MPPKSKTFFSGHGRPADFEGKIYDTEVPRGGPSVIGMLKMWWRMRKGDMNEPFLIGQYLFRCPCGRNTSMRMFLSPKTPGSMPNASVFAKILGLEEKPVEDDPFADHDQDAREAGL